MPEYPNIPFSEGDAWTPDLAYKSFNSPIFDGLTQYLGHRAKIADGELSDSPGQIKDRVSFLENSLRLTREGNGLILRYASGQVMLPNGNLATITSGLLGVTNNATSVIFVDRDGIPRVDSRFPAICVPVARVTAVNGAISTIEDYRHPNLRRVQPNPTALVTFGGQASTDLTTTNGQVLDQGVYYVRDFTVPAGTTCSVLSGTQIFCSGNARVAGTMTVGFVNNQAPRYPYNLTASGTVGGQIGAGTGSNGSTYSWAIDGKGSGGSGGVLQTWTAASWGYAGAGGAGGGSITIEAAGTITVTGTISANGGNGSAGGNDNVSNAPGAFINRGTMAISGSGGGSGGLILLRSLTSVTAPTGATLSVRGGNGGTGFGYAIADNQRVAATGGGGGGGGYIVCQSPNTNLSGATTTLTGGTTGDMGVIISYTGTNYLTQPTVGTWRAQSIVMWLGGGTGGAFGGGQALMTASQATEGGLGTNYWQRQTAESGLLVLQSFLPIG